MNQNDRITPKWAGEIVRFMSVKSQYMLWGNVYDVYPFEASHGIITLRITNYLDSLLSVNGYNQIFIYEPLCGLTPIKGEGSVLKDIAGEQMNEGVPLPCTVVRGGDIIQKIIENNRVSSAVILNFASRLPDISGKDMEEFYYTMFRLSHQAVPVMAGESEYPKFNLLIWILDKENDIPAWYTLDNHKIRVLAVPKPDYRIRKIVIENLSQRIEGYGEMDEKERKEALSLFIDQTGGLLASEIVSIVSLARRQGVIFPDIGEALRMYKLGIIENPWSRIDTDKIEKAEEVLQRRVKGQGEAVSKASDIIKRAVFNLSGAQYAGYSQRPKGVLFLAGPTGVGKTELAKAVTELIFGSETGYKRFDMSEFAREHADQRLVGSPPGYVGYDTGGELTNAVKENPFSVILFDEIEKANPRILDIFLQILDDGRLTSGRGETVYFSETLIVFTSNLGVYDTKGEGQKRSRVTPLMPYSEVKEKIGDAVEEYFKTNIVRPEILNRIGENIIVFDFIRREAAKEILDRMVGMVLDRVRKNYGISIELTMESEKRLERICCSNLEMGGRGIGNKLEVTFINPLSRALFDSRIESGETIIIKDIEERGSLWSLVTERRSS